MNRGRRIINRDIIKSIFRKVIPPINVINLYIDFFIEYRLNKIYIIMESINLNRVDEFCITDDDIVVLTTYNGLVLPLTKKEFLNEVNKFLRNGK